MAFYMKKLKEGEVKEGETQWAFVKIDAEGRSGNEVLRDVYLKAGWADVSEKEKEHLKEHATEVSKQEDTSQEEPSPEEGVSE